MPITTSGYTQPTESEIKSEIKGFFDRQFGLDVDVITRGKGTTETFNIVVQERILVELTFQSFYEMRSLSTATGTWLDDLAQQTGNARLPAQASTAYITFKGNPFITIPANFLISAPAYSLTFKTLGTAQIDETGSVQVFCQCLSVGKNTNVQAGTIKSITNPIQGLSSCINELDAFGGSDVETDDEFRSRIFNLLIDNIATGQFLIQQLNALDGVAFSTYRENTTLNDQNGISALSVNFVVEGGLLSDIGNVFLNYAAIPFRTSGSQEINVVNEFGRVNTYFIDRPQPVQIDIQAIATTSFELSATFEDSLKLAVTNFVDSVGLGNPIMRSEIMIGLGQEFNATFESDLNNMLDFQFLVKLTASSFYSTFIPFEFNQFPQLVGFELIVQAP